MFKYKWTISLLLFVVIAIHPANARELAYCELDRTPKSVEFKQKFTNRYRHDEKYARAYDATLRKLSKAEAATDKAMASLDDQIRRIKAELQRSGALSVDQRTDLQKQLSQKIKEREEVKKYKCETLVPARNKIRTLGELLF